MKSNVKSCLGKIFFFDFYSIRCKNDGVSALYTDVTVCILSDSSADFLPLNDSQLSFIFSSLGCSFHSELRSNAISASPILPLVSPCALWRKSILVHTAHKINNMFGNSSPQCAYAERNISVLGNRNPITDNFNRVISKCFRIFFF